MRKNVSQAFEKLLLYLSQIERERNCQIITGSQNERKFGMSGIVCAISPKL